MPYGHRRPFWYSFVRAKEYIFGGNAFCKSHRICPTRLRSAPEAFSTYKKATAPNGAAAFAFAMIKQKTRSQSLLFVLALILVIFVIIVLFRLIEDAAQENAGSEEIGRAHV